MRKGDVGAEVHELQRLLATVGLPVECDGWFGDETESAVIAFQQRVGLVVDGIAGGKTLLLLRSGDRQPHLLTQRAIEQAAARLGVSVAAVLAVNEVESSGSGFLPDGRPKILFERHVMYKRLAAAGMDAAALAARYPNLVNPQRGGYAGGAAEHARLASATTIDRACAMESCSWGQYQIMGYHWQALGHPSVEDFVAAMTRSENEQLAAFAAFIEADPAMHKALKGRRWTEFARIYNGPAYKENLYDVKLSRAYARHSAPEDRREAA